ncbi:MAG TPA: hypothetical protein VNF74_08980 [Terriglobales bacterium]|nr:hypothetical protein [Terriglobales bacterium]
MISLLFGASARGLHYAATYNAQKSPLGHLPDGVLVKTPLDISLAWVGGPAVALRERSLRGASKVFDPS